MRNRLTPEPVTTLEEDEVFVFGSNEAGIHGAGAARKALEFGAVMGVGVGERGNTYALPTKDANILTLPTEKIAEYAEQFVQHAALSPHRTYLLTRVGCGLAGYTDEDIAPLFDGAAEVGNICLPPEFWAVLREARKERREALIHEFSRMLDCDYYEHVGGVLRAWKDAEVCAEYDEQELRAAIPELPGELLL